MLSTCPIKSNLLAVCSCNLELGNCLETVVAGERLYAERRAAADPLDVAIDFSKQVGDAVGDLVHIMVVRRTDHIVERADYPSHAIEVTQRLLDASEQVDAGKACRLITLLGRQGVADAAGKHDPAVDLGNVSGKRKNLAEDVERLHAPIGHARKGCQSVVRQLDSELSKFGFGGHSFLLI